MTKDELKDYLLEIKQNKYQLKKNMNLIEISKSMLDFIGTTDPELRDELIYVTFYHWIINNDLYSNEQLVEIAEIAINEQHLLYKLGSRNDDSVFTRTFSALLSALLLNANQQRDYLDEKQFIKIKNALFKYLKEEHDLRGYVKIKGWAHGIAHAADAIDELLFYNYISKSDMKLLLKIIQEKVVSNSMAYICLEDQRMAVPVIRIFKKDIITDKEIFNWLKSFNKIEEEFNWSEDRNAIHNLKIFLKSLYFQGIKEEIKESITNQIKEVILKTR